jgi:hypothetical protein
VKEPDTSTSSFLAGSVTLIARPIVRETLVHGAILHTSNGKGQRQERQNGSETHLVLSDPTNYQ